MVLKLNFCYFVGIQGMKPIISVFDLNILKFLYVINASSFDQSTNVVLNLIRKI